MRSDVNNRFSLFTFDVSLLVFRDVGADNFLEKGKHLAFFSVATQFFFGEDEFVVDDDIKHAFGASDEG